MSENIVTVFALELNFDYEHGKKLWQFIKEFYMKFNVCPH